MAKYRKIAPSIWNDAKFRTLSDNARLVFFLLLTHPQTSAIGTLRAYPQGLAPEMGWSLNVFCQALGELQNQGMVICSEQDGLLWLPNFMKYNAPESPNVLRSWVGSLDQCPECELKKRIATQVGTYARNLGPAYGQAFAQGFAQTFGKTFQEAFPEAFKEAFPEAFQEAFPEAFQEAFPEAFPEAFGQPSPNQEQEQEQEEACAEVAVLELPLADKSCHAVTQADVQRWRELYPGVDVEHELRRMRAWLEVNVKKRKTAKGVPRFIATWLDKEQNRAARNSRASPGFLYGQATN
ncbi:MAG: hypothetical protein IJU37_08375 [Desulfovibrio sp.]|nr:hypothetical protein [Desulfovibrio sp.]